MDGVENGLLTRDLARARTRGRGACVRSPSEALDGAARGVARRRVYCQQATRAHDVGGVSTAAASRGCCPPRRTGTGRGCPATAARPARGGASDASASADGIADACASHAWRGRRHACGVNGGDEGSARCFLAIAGTESECLIRAGHAPRR
eukprot:scaffold22058_cov124-Isochrysis_galbana.AAC.7